MGFKLPKGCREYFKEILGKGRNEDKRLPILFDEFYLCTIVGLAQAKIIKDPELEAEFIDTFPQEYQESREYIIGLLIATEVKRLNIDVKKADELEQCLKRLVGTDSKTHLTQEGEELLNQYAAFGYRYIRENMLEHIRLEEFYQDYFGMFENEEIFL